MTEGQKTGSRQQALSYCRDVVSPVSGRYLLHLPPGYHEGEDRWPMLLFLHGMGERGDNLDLVRVHGPPREIDKGRDLPFVVVSPQCPDDTWWRTEMVIGVLEEVMANCRIDADRVYLTGLSMGGYGTWMVGCEQPDRFAALVPVCGGGLWFLASRLVGTPVWAFHGAKDEGVPVTESERMVEAIRESGGDVNFTVYPEAGHDSWTETYANPGLYEWLLRQRRCGDQGD